MDPATAVKDLLAEAYAALEAGDPERLRPLFTDDAMVFGLGPSDTWNDGAAALAGMTQQLLPVGLSGDTVQVSDSRPVVGVAAGEGSAWLFDLPRVKTTRQGQAATWLPRLTGHALKVGDAWRFDALHVSLAVPDAMVSAPDAAKKLLPPGEVAGDRSPDADQLVGLARRSLDDYAVKVDRTSARPEFVQIGTSPAEVFIDGANFKALLKPQLGAIKRSGYTWRLEGNLRVRLAPDGRSGWAAGLVVQRVGAGKKQQVFPAFRYLWVFVEEAGVWNIASEHQSLAVKEDLRAPATAAQLETWKALRQVVEKAQAPAKVTPPAPARDAGVPEPVIEAW